MVRFQFNLEVEGKKNHIELMCNTLDYNLKNSGSKYLAQKMYQTISIRRLKQI